MKKRYRVETTKLNRDSSISIESILEMCSYTGWIFKQVIINESVDEYIIIFEKER